MSGDGRRPQAIATAGAASAIGAARADVEIDVRARARELRVGRAPRTWMRVAGSPGVLEDRVGWRRNLPKRLRAGEVRRDVAVRRRVAGRLADDRERS